MQTLPPAPPFFGCSEACGIPRPGISFATYATAVAALTLNPLCRPGDGTCVLCCRDTTDPVAPQRELPTLFHFGFHSPLPLTSSHLPSKPSLWVTASSMPSSCREHSVTSPTGCFLCILVASHSLEAGCAVAQNSAVSPTETAQGQGERGELPTTVLAGPIC